MGDQADYRADKAMEAGWAPPDSPVNEVIEQAVTIPVDGGVWGTYVEKMKRMERVVEAARAHLAAWDPDLESATEVDLRNALDSLDGKEEG